MAWQVALLVRPGPLMSEWPQSSCIRVVVQVYALVHVSQHQAIKGSDTAVNGAQAGEQLPTAAS